MTIQDDFYHSMELPMVDMIHETLIAFLHTSEQGTWHIDDTKPNNKFKLYFIRGNWGSSVFGMGARRVPQDCDVDSQDELVPHSKPMLLEITIRPSPQDLSINIRHQIFSKSKIHEQDHDEYWVYWEFAVREEIEGLQKYLKKCYSLQDMPQIHDG